MNDVTDNSARAYQNELLQGVARTFALTIPQLPEPLIDVVGNAYLLCRIADTIEDDSAIEIKEKCTLGREFIDIVVNKAAADHFAQRFSALVSAERLPAEKQLIRETAQVIAITRLFSTGQQATLARCVHTMTEGMLYYQAHSGREGFANISIFDNYCYHVAGVVGEMLTELFCQYSSQFDRERLMPLAVSFGQGLQMTNILKDIWEDYARGVCWLPQDVFQKHGFDLTDVAKASDSDEFAAGLKAMVTIAVGHLHNAATYIHLIPSNETGLRKFCLWAVGMAFLTLERIYRKPNFTAGKQVKIGKRQVLTVIALTKIACGNHRLTRWLLKLWSRRLPVAAAVSTDAKHKQISAWFRGMV